MGRDAVPCANCGAMMTPLPDGRTYACAYCNTHVLVAVEGAQIAAGLHLDLANIEVFLAQLANTLSTGFAERSKIHANGRVVMAIEIDVDADVFIVRRDGPRVVAEHKK